MAPMLFSDDASLRADEMYMPRHRRCRCSSGEGVGFGVRMMPWFVVGHARLPPVPLFDDGSGLLAEATSKHDGDSDDDTCGARCASGPRRDDGNVMELVFVLCIDQRIRTEGKLEANI